MPISRRSWLRCLAGACLCWGLAPLEAGPAPQRFEFSKPQMGVPFRIVLYAASTEIAERAAMKAFARVEALNQILSDYEYDSELSALSRSSGSGKAIKLSRELWLVLNRAQELSRTTGGAYDVTVGPFTSLWRKARRDKALPPEDRLQAARAAVGFHHLILDPRRHTALLDTPGMRLDLGSIAKGFAVDEAMHALEREGIRSALTAAAGDLRVSARPPGKAGWDISVGAFDTPEGPRGYVIPIVHRAVCSSGDFFQKLEIDGKRYSHIVNPHTGIGITDHSLVTVIGRDAMTANSWATTISVLGPSRGIAAAEKHGGLAVHIVRQPGDTIDTHNSRDFRRLYLKHGRDRARS